MQRHYTAEDEAAYIASTTKKNDSAGSSTIQWKTVPQGAATSVWAAAVAPADEVGGHYCLDCNVAAIVDSGDLRSGVRSYALDPDHARALWAKGEELVGERF